MQDPSLGFVVAQPSWPIAIKSREQPTTILNGNIQRSAANGATDPGGAASRVNRRRRRGLESTRRAQRGYIKGSARRHSDRDGVDLGSAKRRGLSEPPAT